MGTSEGPNTNTTVTNLDFYGKQATKQLKEGIEESVEADKALRRRRQEHLSALKASRDQLEKSIAEEEPPASSAFPASSPALTINTVIGVVAAATYLFGYTFTDNQMEAVEVIVTASFVLIPVLGAWLIRVINSR